MGATSTGAKQRWNAKHYAQVKISVAPELAESFRAHCISEGASMASKLAEFMRQEVSGKAACGPSTDPYGTRGKRRKATGAVAVQVEAIMDAEQDYMDRMHENFRNSCRYEEAEATVEALGEALELLSEAY